MNEADSKTALPYLYLWMPALYGTGMKIAHEDSFPLVRRIWPGLPESVCVKTAQDRWQPDALPCTPREMGACLRELESFSADMSHGRDAVQAIVMSQKEKAQEAGLKKELDAVQALGGAGALSPEEEAARQREKAQRLLAWFWYQQKNLADIEELVASINKGVPGIGNDLRYDKDEEQEAIDTGIIPLLEALDDKTDKDGINWRLWLEAALTFAPENTVFVWTRVPEELADAGFGAEADFVQGLPCPDGFAIDGVSLKAGSLLPGTSSVQPERIVRLVRIARPASN